MWKKILGAVFLILVVALGGALAWLYMRKPAQAPPRAGKVDMSPARIARGRYIFEDLADCDGCHSQRDFSRFNGPVVVSGRGRGFVFPPEFGLPGALVASNITPDTETGLGAWTDGEKIRAIREGVDKDGRALFPMMPYTNYREMSDEDVESLVAYMNTLAPVRHPLPKTQIRFPVSLFIKSAPRPAANVPPPDRSNKLKYGRYLATMGSCADCHTALVRGRPDEARRLAGGREFHFGNDVVVSANITPDPDTGIGAWTERHFLDKFAEYREYALKGPPPAAPGSFTLMPWLSLSRLPEEELRAIYAYLKTQPAVRNAVERHPGVLKKAGA